MIYTADGDKKEPYFSTELTQWITASFAVILVILLLIILQQQSYDYFLHFLLLLTHTHTQEKEEKAHLIISAFLISSSLLLVSKTTQSHVQSSFNILGTFVRYWYVCALFFFHLLCVGNSVSGTFQLRSCVNGYFCCLFVALVTSDIFNIFVLLVVVSLFVVVPFKSLIFRACTSVWVGEKVKSRGRR